MRICKYPALFLIALVVILTLSGCTAPKKENKVVVYTSVDQVFSEPVLKEFEKASGITLLPVYDVEASKTTGLSNRLVAEKGKPQADVYWSGEFAQTIMLKNANVLAPYMSESAKDIPAGYKDKNDFYTGFGGRARVLLVNTDKIKPEQYPKSIFDLLDSRYKASETGIAMPLFGTTSTHAAALYAQLGDDKAREFFTKLKERGVSVADGNAAVKDMVCDGRLTMGLTDTDDALEAKEKNNNVELVFLDQEEGQMGTLVVANTVALVNNAPNPENGRKLIDFLLSKQTEDKLYDAGWFDFTSRPLTGKTPRIDGSKVRMMPIGFDAIYAKLQVSSSDLSKIFVK